ncbi:TniQ family protein [Nocardioides ultimimeridianus]
MRRLPVRISPEPGEALDGFLERLADINGLTHPQLVRRCAGEETAAFAALRPAAVFGRRLRVFTELPQDRLHEITLGGLAGIDLDGLDPGERRTWRAVAARGWAPARGTAICPTCLRDDGIWRIAWRHPWITTCLPHQSWLLATCPECGLRFRSQRTLLRTVDTQPGTCGNPGGRRGSSCSQPLDELSADTPPRSVLAAAERIWAAVHGTDVDVLGSPCPAADYLAEIKALTALLLHLATQPGGEQLADWADAARADRDRRAGDRGARWGLAPPADLQLRGQAIATADAILRKRDLDEAADALHPWTELTPPTNDGQLGWLADRTAMTPTLTRLVMAATAQRRRLAALLTDRPPIDARLIPQCLPADLYAEHLDGQLGVNASTGRVFASLCLAKLGRPECTWPDAAALLGLDRATGLHAVRACTGEILCGPLTFTDHLTQVAAALAEQGVDYRAREGAVRTLATKRRWYETWARHHRPRALPSSRPYAVTYLWVIRAGGTPRSSPGWAQPPTTTEMAYYRRYTVSMSTSPDARGALLVLVESAGGSERTEAWP